MIDKLSKVLRNQFELILSLHILSSHGQRKALECSLSGGLSLRFSEGHEYIGELRFFYLTNPESAHF